MLSCCLLQVGVWAGPPFVTDDPEPVDLHHWEVYLSSMGTREAGTANGTLPHVEINNGVAPNLQLHVIFPYAFQQAPGMGTVRGYGDTEVGMKYRMIQEGPSSPMAGVFPLLEVPTGNAEEDLGSGHLRLFLPLWLQKSWGPWTTYGGGGYGINPGGGNRNNWLLGWEVQKDLSRRWTLGGELFYSTPATTSAGDQLNANVGGQYNFNDDHHLLFSIGRSLHGDIANMYYLGHQWTFGKGN